MVNSVSQQVWTSHYHIHLVCAAVSVPDSSWCAVWFILDLSHYSGLCGDVSCCHNVYWPVLPNLSVPVSLERKGDELLGGEPQYPESLLHFSEKIL